MNVENKQSEVLSNRTFKKRDGTSTGDHGRKYEVKLLMLYLLHGLSSKIDFWLASNIEGFGAFDDIFFEYKDQKNKSRIILVQAKHCNTHRSSKNITFEDLFIDGNDRKQQKEDFGLNKYFESHPGIKQNPECKNSDITLVIHTNVNVNLKKGTEKQGSVETLEKYLEESKLTNDNTLNIYEGQKGTCYKIKNHTELKKYFSCGSDDEIEDFLLRIRFAVDQPNHSKLDDIIKKEIGNIYKISGEEDIDTVFVRVYDKVGKWWAQQGSKVSYLTRKDDYFREVIEHLYSLKPREDLFERWNIPPKIASGNFIEREYLNEEIVNHLKTKNEPVILTALYGLGGVGKTQSVLDFIQKHGKEYKAICWFNAKDEDQLLSEYVNLGRKLNIIHDEDNISIAQRAYYVKNWLEDSKREGWLLIYDNVSNYEVISKLRPTKGGKIIVTSRNTEWPQGSIGVDVFTPPESELYVKKILGQVSESDRPNIGILAEKLGRLPLALAQACAYIKENKMTISRYLEIYAERKLYLLSHKTLPKDSNHEPVFITWDITMDAIRNESKLASKLLVACAYLDNDIPKDLLRIFPEIVENNSEEKPFEEVLGILLRYSMLVSNEQSSSVSIHCLVQDVIRLKSKESGKIKKDIKTVFQLLKESFPDDSDKLEDYAKKRQLLPHLEAFLSHIDNWLAKNPSEKQTIEKDYLVYLLIWMNDGYHDLGNPRRQKELLEQALSIFKKYYGPYNFQVAIALANLGIAYGDLGNHRRQKELLKQALPILEKHYGSDHFQVAIILTNLSNAYGGLGNPQKAKELLERALAIQEEHYGPDHSQVAVILTNLGIIYGNLGNYEEKKELLERALAIQEKHYEPDHSQVASTLVGLGTSYRALGDSQKAKELLGRALAIQEKHYGSDHFQIAIALINLSNAHGDLGNLQKAKELLERALAIQEKHYEPNHFTVAIILKNLGGTYGDLGDSQKAKELFERALPIFEKHYGPDHLEVAKLLANLSITYGDLGNPQKAKELLEQASFILEKHHVHDYF
ncbi:FxSxx-COOH system tetratricopeptide repeat protein [Wolbachia endosymbiont (group A) of Rhorus exstirpatorius]|uniref:FxSxx-COOH system tetratricopeptide repeat protein n=1 Tax=Wolbachia endosymbiont (group A) of Rhorus exstirpatorius TaxID=3066213 RepID=UPI0033412365